MSELLNSGKNLYKDGEIHEIHTQFFDDGIGRYNAFTRDGECSVSYYGQCRKEFGADAAGEKGPLGDR